MKYWDQTGFNIIALNVLTHQLKDSQIEFKKYKMLSSIATQRKNTHKQNLTKLNINSGENTYIRQIWTKIKSGNLK